MASEITNKTIPINGEADWTNAARPEFFTLPTKTSAAATMEPAVKKIKVSPIGRWLLNNATPTMEPIAKNKL